jgi:hypothetical protein
MSDKFTEEFERIEVHWFHRHLEVHRDNKIKRKGILMQKSAMSKSEQTELEKIDAVVEDFTRVIDIISGHKEEASKKKFKLLMDRDIVEEAVELNDDPMAKDAARAALADIDERLKTADKIKLTFARNVIRFAIQIINDDLVKFKTKLIPAYENAKEEDFTDAIYTKTYYVNKAKKSKKTLEVFKKKLEKGL